MILSNQYPPNYDAIKKAFPACETIPGVIFTYGDTLYNPHNAYIPPDLMVHEEVHEFQQSKTDPAEWWFTYIQSPIFRLQEELEAYRAQYQYALNNYSRPQRRALLDKISQQLSSPLYGSLISYAEAKERIVL